MSPSRALCAVASVVACGLPARADDFGGLFSGMGAGSSGNITMNITYERVCPPGFYNCPHCCDRDMTCECDQTCWYQFAAAAPTTKELYRHSELVSRPVSPSSLYTYDSRDFKKLRHYLRICDGEVNAKKQVGGWCEQLYFDPVGDGSWTIYTTTNGERDYLSVCQDGKAISKNAAQGTCERFFFEPQHDGSYGVYTKHDHGKRAYLRLCDDMQTAQSRDGVYGMCEKIFFEGPRENGTCVLPHQKVDAICPEKYTVCPQCCDMDDDCKCDDACTASPTGYSTDNVRCHLPHKAQTEICPTGFTACPNCCDRNLDCLCDDECGLGPTGFTTDTFACSMPHQKDAKHCPAGYFACESCCDREPDCHCDAECSHAPDSSNKNMLCTAPLVVEEAHCPAGFYICEQCCDRQYDCQCDDWCDEGHTTDDFKCTVPHRSEAYCPTNYTMCPNCCDLDSDCKCDDQCSPRAAAAIGDPLVQCALPHQRTKDGQSGGILGSLKSSFIFVFSVACLFCCGYQLYRWLMPKSTPPPLLAEEEMTEGTGPMLQQQGRQVMFSSGGGQFAQGGFSQGGFTQF